MGHPKSVRTKARRAVILKALEAGHTRSAAAALAGMHRSTLWEWVSDDADMAMACDMAEAMAEAKVSDALIQQAVGRDWKASITWLQHRRRDDWKPPTVTQEVSGPDGGPIELADVRRKVASVLDRYAAEAGTDSVPGEPDGE